MDKFEFGKYLRKIRKERNLTIHQVETYAGVSNSYISLLERGERDIPSPDILKKIAPLYKIEYSKLMETAGYINDACENPSLIIKTDNFSENEQRLIDELKGYERAFKIAKDSNITPEQIEEQLLMWKKMFQKKDS